ncbi:MAG: hypothetical protein CL623_05010 [Arcobacter sp.]|nr:hypothetical protein [Arcobacter sp.]|tara:strand:- start:3947 stop:4498 length:552 start_codon:yes stop_codon:yes gene_type:complete
MSTFLVAAIIVILIIAISLLVILLKLNSQSKNTKKSPKKKSDVNTVILTKLIVDNITLPKKMSQMDYFSLSQAAKQVFESFKALDYANNPSSKLDKVEWHTWQVSLLMAMLKANKGFFIPNNDSLFHKVILTSNRDSIIQSTQKIINKYNNNINVYKSRDELSRDIIWSSKEVSMLFYYMSKN